VAIILVVTYHCGLPWLKGGFVGVDVFFVISGYLIGSLVYKEIRGRSFSASKFYARRARRILPALFVVLAFCYISGFLLLPPSDTAHLGASALATITSSSNIYFWRRASGYFFSNTDLYPLLMTWSLGVEEQFYFLFPMLMLALRRASPRLQFLCLAVLTLISLTASIWGTVHHPIWTFYLLPTRGWEIGTGVLLAVYEANRGQGRRPLNPIVTGGMGILGIGLIALASVTFDRSMPFPGSAALLPVMGAALVIGARSGVGNRILSWSPFVFIGKVSYSWYLWHWPLLSLVRNVVDVEISKTLAAILGLLSFGAAVLTYRLVETPFRRSMTRTPVLLWRYAVLAMVFMLPASVFLMTDGLPQRNRNVQSLETAEQQLLLDHCEVLPPVVQLPLGETCTPRGNGPALALIGDSHAAMLAPALRSISERSGLRFIELNKSNCPALDGVSSSYANRPDVSSECFRFNREREAFLEHDASIQIVVIAGYWSRPFHSGEGAGGYIEDGQSAFSVNRQQSLDLLRAGLTRLIVQMELAGKTVYIAEDIPGFYFDPSRLILNRLIAPRRALAGVVTHSAVLYPDGVAPDPATEADEQSRSVIAKVAADRPEVHLIDLRAPLCGTSGCRFAMGDQALYVDWNHLSPLGAQIALAGLRLR
jgi:peptidoglycan/LPS O-acetylase OafA/YrhL